jgi:uncharacterized membrane protein YeaQ/YmgE (transglycosylase-associated protein family)
MNPILWFLFIGLTAGWLAGQFERSPGFGILGNIVVGITGAVIGGFLFHELATTPGGGLLGSMVVSTISAVLLLYLQRQFRKV